MKRLFIFLVTFIFSVLSTFAGENDLEQLPRVSRVLLSSHFKNNKVIKVTCNKKKRTYKVNFDKGMSIAFDKNGEWTGIDCNREPVPFLLVPSMIRNKVARMYGVQTNVIKLMKTKRKICVYLNNGIQLTFRFTSLDEVI